MNITAKRILNKLKSRFSIWSRRNILLPHLPKSPRETAADVIYTLLRMASRYGFVVAGLWGWLSFGGIGALASAILAAMLGLWIYYSLGLRRGHVMHAFRVRILERAFGSRRRLLEALVEKMRGKELTTSKCAMLAGIYKLADSHLAAADSATEQQRIRERLEQEICGVVYRAKADGAQPSELLSTIEDSDDLRPADVSIEIFGKPSL